MKNKDKKFANEVVVVTGASAGLGRAIALEFARQGANVALLARNQARLDHVKNQIEKMGSQALVCPLDVSNADLIERAAEYIEGEWGSIDIWVNNAMVSVLSPIKQMDSQEFRRVMDVNYLGTVNGTLSALKRMRKRNKGVILQIGSVLAYRGIPLQAAYCASKHAIQGFHDTLRTELIHEGSAVRVVMIQMPALNTPQFDWVKSRLMHKPQPVPPIFQPEVGVDAVLWAAEHECRELNVGFLSSVFIWGNKIWPGLGDWYLAHNGYKSQQTNELEDPYRADNLWESVDGNFGAHGRFDSQAKRRNYFLWFQTHIRPFMVGLFLFFVISFILINKFVAGS